MGEMAGGKIGSTQMDGGGEGHNILRLVFGLLWEWNGARAGGNDGCGDDGEVGDFHESEFHSMSEA
jgi:hypothetical protein